jgi:hypothetical protein
MNEENTCKENLKNLMLLRKYHKQIEDDYDLGSPAIITISLNPEGAIITDSHGFNFGGQSGVLVPLEDVGKAIAETIMLKMECPSCEFGDWLHSQSLPALTKVLDAESGDFYLDVELKKFWAIARIICNNLKLGKTDSSYLISWDNDSDSTTYWEFKTEESIKDFLKSACIELD